MHGGDEGCEVNHMLKSFTLKNFKSFKEATLLLTPTVTFLIGANGSGKSNALDALRLLNWLGKGNTLEEFEKKSNSENSIVRCPSNELCQYDKTTFELDCVLGREEEFDYSFSIQLALSEDKIENQQLLYHQEVLKNSKNEQYYIADRVKLKSQMGNFVRGKSDSNAKAVFHELEALSSLLLSINDMEKKNEDKIKNIQKSTGEICKQFSSISFLEPTPQNMRGYRQQIKGMSLSETGDNLSVVLEELCRDDKVKKDILNIIQSLPEQEILDISFSRTDENFLMLKLEESFCNKQYKTSAYSLSDGTLRALAIATALYSVPEESLLVIEEVDNGIHPSRIQHLVDKMYEIAAERKIQILVTTHDPAMMNAIPQQEIGNVLCCYRDKEDGSSKTVRLSDSPQYMDILFNGRLGNQVVSPKFEENIKKTSEERKKEHEAWVKQYEKEQDEYDKALKKALGEK